ncbi:TadE/TadG family type IV pilus assembly protein [Altererythrobacter fulvus]|uniref:TadE/TadG family type IV pilus assembly protein n=1 Tax=Caenibius fulvus TaxID=2126012 RepID=UPI003017D091
MIGRILLNSVRCLAGDARGATLPEFAIVLPTFLLLLFGIFDLGQGIYVQSVLQGAIQDAGRDAGLESGTSQKDVIDQYVRDQLRPIAISNPTYTIERKNYSSFADVGRPEDFTDSNKNDKYDSNECFVDENGNNSWDGDVGKGGQGGANDVVLYTVTVSYNRVFPLWKLISSEERSDVSASTVLRNQPFGPQAGRATKQVCPGV